MKDAVNHLRLFPASTLDVPSLLNLKTQLTTDIERHDAQREKLAHDCPTGIADWDALFRADIRDAQAAINDIDAELNLRKVAA